MIYYLTTSFVFLFEFFIVYFVYLQIFSQKKSTWITTIAGLSFFTVYYILFFWLDNFLINTFFMTIITFLFAKLFFDASIKKSIVFSIILTALMTITELFAMTLLSLILHIDIKEYSVNVFYYVLFSALSKIIYFITSVILVRISKAIKISDIKRDAVPSYILIYPLSALFIILVFWIISMENDLNAKNETIILISIASLTIATVFVYVFYFYSSKNKSELIELQLAMEKVSIEKEYYKLLDYQEEELKRIVHDEKNHLQVLKEISRDDEVKSYIDSIYSDLAQHEIKVYTKNHFLDILINKYIIQCELNKIDFIINIKTANLLFMDDSDITILITNLLDNAITAAMDSQKRCVELNINTAMSHTVITCVNACDSEPKVMNNRLISTKNAFGFHGYGIKNIKKITKKYNGDYHWRYDADAHEFLTTISLKSI